MPDLIKSLPPPPVEQDALQPGTGKFAPSFSSWFWLLRQSINQAPVGSSTQSAIQFQYNGVDIGGNGSVTGLDFVGNINRVSIVGTSLTVTAQQMALSELMAFAAANG
jgi:hypothetical protein